MSCFGMTTNSAVLSAIETWSSWFFLKSLSADLCCGVRLGETDADFVMLSKSRRRVASLFSVVASASGGALV